MAAGDVTRPLLALLGALALHGIVAGIAASVGLHRAALPGTQRPLEVAVVEKPRPPPPPPPKEPEKPKPVKKLARARPRPRRVETPPPPRPAPRPPVDVVPPRPTIEAKGPPSKEPIRVLAGVTLESTSQAGSFAVPVGNTLAAAPERVAPDPAQVKPYKAERYAPVAQVNELPSVLSRPDIRRFYPPDALKSDFEGDVVLRLLIDGDGSLAKVEVVSDPGRGLGNAAVKAIREFRFSPAKRNGTPVATTVSFVVHFVIN